MSSTNRVKLSYVEETTYGVTPANPTLQEVPFTSDSLSQNPSFSQSSIIVADRQVKDVIRTDVEAGGDVNFELIEGKGSSTAPYGFPDDWFLGALLASDYLNVADETITATFVPKGANPAKIQSVNAVLEQFVPGTWLRVTGASNAQNNAWCRVIANNSNSELEVIVVNAQGDFVSETSTANVTLKGVKLATNGTTVKTYSILRQYQDLTDADAEIITGAAINGFRLRTETGAILNGSFTFLGKDAASGTPTGATITAASTGAVLNAVDHVMGVVEGSDVATFDLTSLEITVENGYRGKKKVAALGATDVIPGTFVANITFRGHYESKTIVDKMLNANTTSLAFVVEGPSTKGYVFDFPNVRLTGGSRVAGGQNQDVIFELTGQAFKSPTEAITMKIGRLI